MVYYLDMNITISEKRYVTKIYDKRDTFNCKFPFYG